jgi:hypothetical protein
VLPKYLVDGEENLGIVHGSRAEPMEEEEREEEDDGSFSPQVFDGDENEKVIEAEEDRAMLERKRMAVLQDQQKRIQAAIATAKPPPQEDDFEMKKAAMRAMGEMQEGDVLFGSGSEVNLDLTHNSWNDKYRPRKPKYYNRFHTGYEWNKYNQTHYDHDNPPPKVVLGYKFNIFYPDLMDRTTTPSYTIDKDEHVDNTSNETCIIRFHGGPPYEDIAFRKLTENGSALIRRGSNVHLSVAFCTFTSTSNDTATAGDRQSGWFFSILQKSM